MGLAAPDAVPSISNVVWFFFPFVARGGILSLPLIGTGEVAQGRFRLLSQIVYPVAVDYVVHRQRQQWYNNTKREWTIDAITQLQIRKFYCKCLCRQTNACYQMLNLLRFQSLHIHEIS